MSMESKDRNIDDFINELKKSSDKFSVSNTDNESSLFDYEINPLQKVEKSIIENKIHEISKVVEELQKNQAIFSEHLHKISTNPSSTQEIISKVENFMNYFTQKMDERITNSEQKLKHEQQLFLKEIEKRTNTSSFQQQNYQTIPPNYFYQSYPPQEPKPHHGMQEYIRQEMMKETDASINQVYARIKKSEGLLVNHIDKSERQMKHLFGMAIPKWIYILNLIFLAGIFLFLLNHFLNNYSIQPRNSYIPNKHSTQPIEPSVEVNSQPEVVTKSSHEILPMVAERTKTKKTPNATNDFYSDSSAYSDIKNETNATTIKTDSQNTHQEDAVYLASDE